MDCSFAHKDSHLARSCGISPPFGRLFHVQGQVSHVLLTRSPLYSRDCSRFLVRLACVRHAASVDSEPGSNSRLKPVVSLTGSQGRLPSPRSKSAGMDLTCEIVSSKSDRVVSRLARSTDCQRPKPLRSRRRVLSIPGHQSGGPRNFWSRTQALPPARDNLSSISQLPAPIKESQEWAVSDYRMRDGRGLGADPLYGTRKLVVTLYKRSTAQILGTDQPRRRSHEQS